VLGVDLGTRRIGLAGSDPSGTLATPLAVLQRSGDDAADRRAIVAAAQEREATTIVVGMPLTLRGDMGPAARAIQEEIDALTALAAADDIEVVTWDERFTTVIAAQGARDLPPKRRRNFEVDAAAAAVILQSWLEAHR
jgi:putative Holliday junction resolvase